MTFGGAMRQATRRVIRTKPFIRAIIVIAELKSLLVALTYGTEARWAGYSSSKTTTRFAASS